MRHSRPSPQFTWTASELKTYSGFYVAPANKNPDENELKFLVVRYQDERSSDLCKEIEAMSFSQGGIVIRDKGAISRGLSNEYYTNLFHSNCRCRLVLKPDAFDDSIDAMDFEMAAGNSIFREMQARKSRGKLSEDLMSKYTSFDYQKSVQNVIDVNKSSQQGRLF